MDVLLLGTYLQNQAFTEKGAGGLIPQSECHTSESPASMVGSLCSQEVQGRTGTWALLREVRQQKLAQYPFALGQGLAQSYETLTFVATAWTYKW